MTALYSELEVIEEETVHSIISPTIGNPIKFNFRSIAYNGSVWLAGSIDIVRKREIFTYADVIKLLNAYYDYGTFIKVMTSKKSALEHAKNLNPTTIFDGTISYLNGRISTVTTLQKIVLSQANSTYKYFKNLNYPVGYYSFNTLHTLATSVDGYSWKLVEANPFQPEVRAPSTFYGDFEKSPVVNGISWNSTLKLWIAVASRGPTLWNKTQYGGPHSSTSTLTQISQPDLDYYDQPSIYTNNGDFINGEFMPTPTSKTIIATSSDAENWTQFSIDISSSIQPSAYGVACSPSLTIVVGMNLKAGSPTNSTILTSADCKIWTPRFATQTVEIGGIPTTIGLTTGMGVAYNGSLWVLVGRGTSIVHTSNTLLTTSLYTSTDGITWTPRALPSIPASTGSTGNDSYDPPFRLKSVAWNGLMWIAVGSYRSAYKSEDGGFSWVQISDSQFSSSVIYEFNSVTWDGNFWVVVGSSNTYRSKDSIEWEKINDVGGYSVASNIPLPILGGSIQETNSIIIGQGSPSSMIRSSDNLKWFNQIFDSASTTYIGKRQKIFSDLIWTGSYWIAVGDSADDGYSSNIAKSSNGTDWSFPTNGMANSKAVGWNGSMLIVIGKVSRFSPANVVRSIDQGETWISGELNLAYGNCIAWNGSRWIAGGYPGMVTSTDGITWTQVYSLTTSNLLEQVNSVAWNGYIWVATGKGKSHSIIVSINGLNWYPTDLSTNPFTEGFGLAWNKNTWIAVGSGDYNSMASSIDGYTWTGMEKTTFGTSGTCIAWTGSKWIAGGIGYYSTATSTNGTTWVKEDLSLNTITKVATKDIVLPYTGVANVTILASVSLAVSYITSLTTTTIAANEAAIKAAADAVAAAAAAALDLQIRTTAKNSAASYRMEFLFWKKVLGDQIGQLNDTTFIDLKTEYPLEYILANSIYEKIISYVTLGQSHYEKIFDPNSDVSVVSTNIQCMESFNSTLDSDLVQFYNNSRYLFKKILDSKYDQNITNSNTLTIINNFGYTTADRTKLLNRYNGFKTIIDSARATANTLFDTEIASISYSIDLPTSYLFNADIMDQVFVNGTYPTIYSKITTTAPNFYSAYTSVNFGSTTNNAADSILGMNALFKLKQEWKEEADGYLQNALSTAEKWRTVFGTGSSRATEINAAFAVKYNKYFYISELPYFYETLFNTFLSKERTLSVFKTLMKEYTHPAKYILELTSLYNSLQTTINTIKTTRINAITYSNNVKKTTVKNKLDVFFNITKTKYTSSLGIDEHIQTLCNLTYYSNSSYVKVSMFAKLVGVTSILYPLVYPLIQAIYAADEAADDDGCTPPLRGYGSAEVTYTNTIPRVFTQIPKNEQGKQGYSGWVKYVETNYSRQRLVEYMRINSFRNSDDRIYSDDIYPIYTNIEELRYIPRWKDFLNFTNDFTYDLLEASINDLNSTVSLLNANTLFSQTTIDAIVAQDLTNIQSQVQSAAEAYIDSLLVSTTEKLPSNEDLVLFGTVTYNGSNSLSSMVSSINAIYDQLTEAATISLSGKTNAEIQTIVENAINYKNTINTIQDSTAYNTILNGISVYKNDLQRATAHIERMENRLMRWTRMSQNAIKNSPFPISELENGSGNRFIVSVLPTDTNYWLRRKYTSFFNLETRDYEECGFNLITNKIVTVPQLELSKFDTYLSTTSYKLYDMVKYNGKIYECIKDNSTTNIDLLGNTFIVGVVPTNTARWKRRIYPYVTANNSDVEASPENLQVLNISDFEPYTPTYSYVEGDSVRSGDSIYKCINDISRFQKIKGVLPTNNNYWDPVSYPLVVYNGISTQASPTNLPILNLNNYQEYSSSSTYYKGNYVKQNSKIYELVEYISSGKEVTSSSGSSPADNQNNRWVQRTYPVVFVNGIKTEAIPGTFSQLNIQNYTQYSNTAYYFESNFVKYNNEIYHCTLKNRSSLIGISVTNSEFWIKITYPMVLYNGKFVEAIPGAIQPLNATDFKAWDAKTRYYATNTVKYNDNVYECTSNVPYGVGIINKLPTVTQYWTERIYPYVLVDSIEVEANPSSDKFVVLNPLDYHVFQKNFLYYIGDKVSYNGYVYECINVTPPLIGNTTITNIPLTTLNRWRNTGSTLETTYKLQHWFPTISYDASSLVSYNGKIYMCETISKNNIPSELGIYWREYTDYTSLEIPNLYSASAFYGRGATVSNRELATNLPNNETHKLNFYICIATENRPVRYTYDKLYTLDIQDADLNYKTKVEYGNYNDYDLPRYGLEEDDPFNIPMFASKLRRRSAMDIELPYGVLRYDVEAFNERFKRDFKVRLILTENTEWNDFPYGFIKPPNALTVYNELEARGTIVYNTFKALEANKATNIYTITKNAYSAVIEYLKLVNTRVSQYAEQIKTMKTQYFNSANTQYRIYQNPYRFMNPVAFAKRPPRKMFIDLGIGNLSEMESEVYSGNQMNYTTETIRMYKENEARLNGLQENISDRLIQSKCITGFGVLYKMANSRGTMGGKISCYVEGYEDMFQKNRYYGRFYYPIIDINLPIADYDILQMWNEYDLSGTFKYPNSDGIVNLIDEITISSIKLPDYILGSSQLLQALTYESTNPLIKGLSSVAKGLVGLAAATFKNFVDPWQIFGAIEFVGQVLTNDYEKKILTFIPEGKWPTFNDTAGNIRSFKTLVNIEKKRFILEKDEYDVTTLAQFLETVGKLIRLNQKDIVEIDIAIRDVDDYIVASRTGNLPVTIPTAPNPPPDFIPPSEPNPPELKSKICQANLIAERDALRSMQRNLENRLSVIAGGSPSPSKYYVPIPEAVRIEVTSVISGSKNPSKWAKVQDLDDAASSLTKISKVRGQRQPNYIPSPKAADIPKQNAPSSIVVNQKQIDFAIEERKVKRAELKQAKAEAALKNAQRKMIIAQMEDVRLREVQMTAAIDETDLKNALLEADNDAELSFYKRALSDQQEAVEALRDQQAAAEVKYEKQLSKYEKGIYANRQIADAAALDLKNSKNALTDINTRLVALDETRIFAQFDFEKRLLGRPPIVALMRKAFPASFLAQYDDIANSTGELLSETAKRLRGIIRQGIAPAASAITDAKNFLANRPAIKPFVKFAGTRAGRFAAASLGPMVEIVGIGLQAWQDGAFSESETLDG